MLCRIKKCKLIHVVMTHWAGQVCIVNSLKIDKISKSYITLRILVVLWDLHVFGFV